MNAIYYIGLTNQDFIFNFNHVTQVERKGTSVKLFFSTHTCEIFATNEDDAKKIISDLYEYWKGFSNG